MGQSLSKISVAYNLPSTSQPELASSPFTSSMRNIRSGTCSPITSKRASSFSKFPCTTTQSLARWPSLSHPCPLACSPDPDAHMTPILFVVVRKVRSPFFTYFAYMGSAMQIHVACWPSSATSAAGTQCTVRCWSHPIVILAA